MFRLRKGSPQKFEAERKGCDALLEIVLEGANSNVFSKQKAALTALGQLREERCIPALIHVVREFSGSDDLFKQHLAKKAGEYLKRAQS